MATKQSFKARLTPTQNQTFEITGGGEHYNFVKILREGLQWQRSGDIQRACQSRLDAVQRIEELLTEGEPINLEWEHANSQAALEIIHASAVDHFLIEDYELSAAMLELLLELDPEDHLEAVVLLGFNYIKLEEYDSYIEIEGDLSEKNPARYILKLWYQYRQNQTLDKSALQTLKSRFKAYFEEFTREEHPADESYLKDIESATPSTEASARELWLKSEPLWLAEPQFIELLKSSR